MRHVPSPSDDGPQAQSAAGGFLDTAKPPNVKQLSPDAVISVWPHNTLTANHPKTGGAEIPSEQGK
jgi:hypothetical protein